MRQHRADTPWTLESIVRKCLAPDPDERYQEAEQLADDLGIFLDDRPLRYAPELSRVEQIQKYFRRHPRLAFAVPIVAGAILLVMTMGLMLAGAGKNLATTRSRLFVAAARERKQAHDAGTTRKVCLINTEIGLADNLSQGIKECIRSALYEVPGRTGQEHPDWSCFDRTDRLNLAEDQRELYLLLSHARVRRAHGDPRVVRNR